MRQKHILPAVELFYFLFNMTMKKQLGVVALSVVVALSAVVSANTGTVATTEVATGAVVSTGEVMTGEVATGTVVATGAVVATGEVMTGEVATGAVVDTGAKVKSIHDVLDGYFKKKNQKSNEKKSLIAHLVATLKDAEAKLAKRDEHLKADYALVISALESYKI